MTRAGPLDLLGTVTKGRRYEQLIHHSIKLNVGKDLSVHVLDLETLITLKEETGFEKDKAVLSILRRTLEEQKKK